MVEIDLAQLPVREANERIRAHGEAGEDVEVINPDARHHIGVGLTAPIRVRVRGSAGYFCAGLSDEARFEVDAAVRYRRTDEQGTSLGLEFELRSAKEYVSFIRTVEEFSQQRLELALAQLGQP